MPFLSKSPFCVAFALVCAVAVSTDAGAQQAGTTDTSVRVLKTPLAPVTTTATELDAKLEDVGFYRRRDHSGVPGVAVHDAQGYRTQRGH